MTPDPGTLSEAAEWEARMARISPEVATIAEDVWTEDEPTLAEYELVERILAAHLAAVPARDDLAARVEAVLAICDGYDAAAVAVDRAWAGNLRGVARLFRRAATGEIDADEYRAKHRFLADPEPDQGAT